MAIRSEVPSGSSPVLLERETELEGATGAIERACSGAGGVVVVEGPAGIGKTELIRVVRGLALDVGMEVLSARGDDLERDFAYGVVRQLFEPPLNRAPPGVRATLLEGAAALSAGVLGSSTFPLSPAEGSYAVPTGSTG
jgi:predicted ATPase